MIRFFIVCLLLCACDSTEEPPLPPEPTIPGVIIFSAKDANRAFQVYSVNPDGANLRQLTQFTANEEAFNPAWHPNGDQIIFSSWKEGTSTGPALWVMDQNGSNLSVLFDTEPSNPDIPPLGGNNPRWSPDGSKVIFDLCLGCSTATNNDIFVFDILAQEIPTRLTDLSNDEPSMHTRPTWNPQGTLIAFLSNQDYVNGDTLRFRTDAYVMKPDGSDVQRLTESGYVRDLIWGPGANEITYVTSVDAATREMYTLNVVSGEQNQVNLSLDDEFHIEPAEWSPDGKYLLVTAISKEFLPWYSIRLIDIANEDVQVLFMTRAANANPVIRGAHWLHTTDWHSAQRSAGIF